MNQKYEVKSFNEKLRFLRFKNGFTQNQMSEMLNIHRSAYSYYETGKSEPPIKTLVWLGKFFEVSLDVLLDDEKNLFSSPFH